MRVARFDRIALPKLDAVTTLGDGSLRIPARLSRVGVQDYGGHREARFAEDVFAPAALDSFRGLVVTDGHRAWVDATNWKTYAIGHVADDVRRDGIYVAASLVIADADAQQKILRGELQEISMGYAVELEKAPGVLDGQAYDYVQRDIVGNHAALGGVDWGRAGPEVRLRLEDGRPRSIVDAAAERMVQRHRDAWRRV